ncbi:MAG: protein kinase [Candidatus Melainabacteria bacterium]|nr:protein kinase [Candidatus Melainabacteria bacterium]
MSDGLDTPEKEKIPPYPNLGPGQMPPPGAGPGPGLNLRRTEPQRLAPPSLNQATGEGDQPSPTELFGIPISPLQGRYEFITVIGAGGAGVIYKAKQKPLGRPVAVKMIHSHLVNVTALKRFLQEAKTISTMHHPNIISVHDFGVSEDNQPYMVMDYVEGTTLSDYIKKEGALEPEFAVNLAMQICDGLSHAHSHNVLHRDLKPNNVMLVPLAAGEHHLRVLDFGLAKLFAEDEQADHLTKTGETVGTPAYMSPEQVMGKKLSPRSDIYSLGCLMYHCLTGFVPFGGATKMETMLKQLNDPPPPFSEYDIDVSERLEELVMQILSKDPAGRPESMSQVKERLKALISYHSSGNVSALARKEKKKAPAKKIEIEPKKIAMIAVPLLLVSVAGLATFFYTQQKPTLKPDQTTQASNIEPTKQNAPVVATKTEQSEEPSANATTPVAPAAKEEKPQEQGPNYKPDIDDEEFLGKFQGKEGIRELSSDGHDIQNQDLYYVAKLKNLKMLDLTKSQSINDSGVAYLKNMSLVSLLLGKTGVTDKGLDSIGTLKSLVTLDLNNTLITANGLGQLTSCRNLRNLDLHQTNLKSGNLDGLKGLNNLEMLVLGETGVGDTSLSALANMKMLKTLYLNNTAITNTGLNNLTNLENLQKLDLSGTKIDNRGLKALSKLPNLAVLNLKDLKLGKDAVGEMCKFNSHLREVDFTNTGITRAMIAPLQNKFDGILLRGI